MSDQSRLLIAAALMAVVLFVSWQFMGRSSGTTETTGQAVEVVQQNGTVTGQIDTTAATASGELPEDVQGETAVEDTLEHIERSIHIIIRDNGQDLVLAEISNSTGSIVRWDLPQFESMPGSDLDGCVGFDGNVWIESNTFFICDSPDTVIVDDSQEIVTLNDPVTGRIVEYTFTPGYYGFQMRREGFEEITVLSSGILPVSEMNVSTGNYYKAQWNSEKVKSRNSGDIDMNDQVGNVQWIASRSKYFGIILMPLSYERAYGYVYASSPDQSPSVGISDRNILVYAGPLDYGILRTIGRDTHLMVDFGWPLIRDIGRLLFWFCTSVLSFVGNWGVKIILMSIALKVVLLPLTTKSFRSMAKLKQVQPKMKALQEKYKNDPKALQGAMQKLYREEGVNPLGGCLPLLLQMPVFFALYRVLANSVQLRGAEFMLWIKDLSNPEILIPFSSPIMGLHGIGLLAVLMGIAMFLQQKMTTADQSQKGMMYILPIFMTFLFMRFPAGLTLYWFMNNILTIAQQQMINRKLEAEAS